VQAPGTDKPIGKPVIVVPCRAEAAGRLAFPAHPPWPFSASPRARDLRRAPPVCRKGLRGPASVDRRDRSPDHAHPPWPLPPLRSLHPVLADPSRWKPPRLVSRLSWDSSVRLSIDLLLEPGPLALPPPGRVGMPLPTHCRSRGFAPPQRLTVSRRCRSIASCCRSWGSSRFILRAAFADRASRPPRASPSPRRVSYPSKNPLASSRTASPRPLPSYGSTDLRAPTDRFRSRTETPDATADFDGLWPTDCSADLHTSPGASSTTEVTASSPGIDRAPGTAALPPPPLRVEAEPGSTGRVGRFKALLHRRVRASRTGLVTGDASTVLPGLRSPSRSSCRRPCGRGRRRHRRSGRGHRAPIRRPVDACRARCDEDHTRRQAWGAEDTGKPGPRPDATLAGRAPRFLLSQDRGRNPSEGSPSHRLRGDPALPESVRSRSGRGGSAALRPV